MLDFIIQSDNIVGRAVAQRIKLNDIKLVRDVYTGSINYASDTIEFFSFQSGEAQVFLVTKFALCRSL